MALSTPALLTSTSFGSSTGTTPTTASFTPTANSLMMVVFGDVKNSASVYADPTGITATHTGQGAFTEQAYQTGIAASNTHEISVWTSQTGSSPGAGTVTVNLTVTTDRAVILVCEITGHNTTTPVKNIKTGSDVGSATPSLTLDSTPDTDSTVMGFLLARDDTTPNNMAPGANFTELVEANSAGSSTTAEQQGQYDANSATTTVDWSNCKALMSLMAAFEIDVAAVGGGKPWYAYAQQ